VTVGVSGPWTLSRRLLLAIYLIVPLAWLIVALDLV